MYFQFKMLLVELYKINEMKVSDTKWPIPKLRMGNCSNSTNKNLSIAMRYF